MNKNCPILKNIETGVIIHIDKSPFTLGRNLLNNYVIENTIVSRTHFTLNNTPSGWTLTDSSTNGTFINGNHYHKKTSPFLKNNDEISLGIGNYTYKFSQEVSEHIQDSGSSRDSKISNNFQDISDEVLNNWADNILQDIETTTRPLPVNDTSPSVIQSNPVCQGGSNQSKIHPRDTNQIAGPSNINLNAAGMVNKSTQVYSNIVTPSESRDIVDNLLVPVPDSEDSVISSMSEPTGKEVKNICLKGQKNPNSPQAGFSKATEKTVPPTTTNNQQFEDMENELACTICTCLFIKAVTLGCSHSFCQYCIEMWKKKKSVCPICRQKITSSHRTLVLDNVVEKMLERAPEELKNYRKVVLDERKEIDDTKKNTGQKMKVSVGRRRDPVIVIQDSSHSSESSNSDMSEDDSEWDDGIPGAYYGGYGRCFNCGARGHWTTGCPFR